MFGKLGFCFLYLTSYRVIMEEQLLNKILEETFTLEVFKRRYQALKIELQNRIYGSGKLSGEEAQDLVASPLRNSDPLDKHWLESFDPKMLSEVTNDQFNSIKLYIDTFINNIPPLSIYFVFLPEPPQIKEVGNWLRKNLNNPKLIFDIKVDPSLIGGCAVVYKGVYRDYSLKAKISEHKEEIIGEFRKYLK